MRVYEDDFIHNTAIDVSIFPRSNHTKDFKNGTWYLLT